LQTLIIAKSSVKKPKNLISYLENLKREGWIDVPLEGGVMSPDYSTLFIAFRTPYEGQLLQFRKDKIKEYNFIVRKFVD